MPCGSMFHKVRIHVASLTLPHGADGGVVANLTDPPYSVLWSTLRRLHNGTLRGYAYPVLRHKAALV